VKASLPRRGSGEQGEERRRVIAVWWIGETAPDEALLQQVRAHVTAEFKLPTVIWRSAERPTGTYDARRQQHSSREVLRWLVAMCPAGASRVIGITDVDLFMPVLTFVFGEAQLGGIGAVVSTARLVDRVLADRTLRRAVKECVHEVGHTFGLTHCSSAGCVMTRSTNVQAVDGKQPQLCEDCRARYAATQQDGLHV
jgi:archaemetzincin